MSPRPGGEADKFGGRYEGRWTVRQLLYVLLGEVDSITVEEVGDIGEKVEFRIQRGPINEVHQVKRQYRNATAWSVSALNNEGVLRAAHIHVAAGREFHFVSMTPFPKLASLAERAYQSANLQIFVEQWLTKELRPIFNELSGGKTYNSAEVAWQTLRGFKMHCIDEADLCDQNSAFAGLLLNGAAPSLAAVGLGEVVLENLAKTLDVSNIEAALPKYRLARAQRMGNPSIAQTVRSMTENWKDRVDRELLKPVITRSEAGSIAESLGGDTRLLLVTGAAGDGKSAALFESVTKIESQGWNILAFRLDRVEPFSSTTELGRRLGLDISPVSALAAVSGDKPSLVVVDQLDAVSLASGRMPANFDAVAELLREARAFPAMRVLLACRKFDIDNDPRIRTISRSNETTQFEIPPLHDQQVAVAVRDMSLDPSALTSPQRELLRSPLNLVLLRNVADETDALSFDSGRDLLDAYWDHKRRDCRARRQPPPKFIEVVRVLADAMSAQQRLAVSESLLDAAGLLDDADVLASAHVVVRDDHKFAFFHEIFFDYAFARQWVSRDETLVDFLIAGEQELFRRGQVRQILAHLRDEDPHRFVEEIEDLLINPEVRFHIKYVVLASLRALPAPTVAEWEMVERIAATEPDYANHLWFSLRTVPWFDLLDAEGIFIRWLGGKSEDHQGRAIEIMGSVAKQRPDRVAVILTPFVNHKSYPLWLRWIVLLANIWQSRPLFELLLDAVRRGTYEGQEEALWSSTYALNPSQAAWAVELLAVYFNERPNAHQVNDTAHMPGLLSTEHGALELINKAVSGAPAEFCAQLMPFMLQVMALTEYEDEVAPVEDRHFSHRNPPNGYGPHRVDESLLFGAAEALRSFVPQDPAAAASILDGLAADQHESAQFLLYEALRSDAGRYAQLAARVLLEGEHRFFTGYTENRVWAARQLIQSISPFLVGQVFADLEQAIVGLQKPDDKRRRDSYQFSLLSALDENRLSQSSRRLLTELRRRFERDQPIEPQGIVGGWFGSPIPPEATQRMTDDQWLGAMNKYDQDIEDFATLRGGVHELAGVLRTATAADPVRFARLSLRLTGQQHSAYANAILQGLRQPEVSVDPEAIFAAIRHIANLAVQDNDQSLPDPLISMLDKPIPDDVIGIVLDRALHSSSPAGDAWMTTNSGGVADYNDDIYSTGINTARGHCADVLGDLLIYDADGHRTSLVLESLETLASDPSVAVRSCVAHLLGTALRHARAEAVQAFGLLVQADDRLLTARSVIDLIRYAGNGEPAVVVPVVERMLKSKFEEVRHWGGQLAAYCALRYGYENLLTEACSSTHNEIRAGVAIVCAQSLPYTSDMKLTSDTLVQLVVDDDEKVRESAALVAAVLRGHRLGPFDTVLKALIASSSFKPALAQLLITLAQAPDRIDKLIIACVRRFIEVFGAEAGDISKAAAGEAAEVAELLIRAYSQAARKDDRATALDLIDALLLSGAYDVEKWIESARR